MADNASSGGGGGGGGDDNRNELLVSIAALVISIIAFFISVAQALQQYYGSAQGFSNCSTAVMDGWGAYTRRMFLWSEFRFEVRFQAPVLFIASPSNKFGPVKKRPIYYITGGDEEWLPLVTKEEGYVEGWWEVLMGVFSKGRKGVQKGVKKMKVAGGGGEGRQSVQTAETEKASWLALLQAVDEMEKKSIEWQEDQYSEGTRSSRGSSPMHTARTMAVAVQARTRSWDTMPASTNKPLATTTIGHVVEVAAMLGLHWSEFDQKENQYRADGNGFKLSGSYIEDTGVVFKMFKTGKNKWEDNRLIPMGWVKEFCFGYVPTIFRAKVDPATVGKGEEKSVMKPGFKADPTPRELKFPADAEINSSRVHTLQLGSTHEISETLVLLGCNTITREYFSKDGGQDVHLFPVVFELVGMLSQTIHISGTSFQMLPNPTIYQWDNQGFDLLRLLMSFENAFCNAPSRSTTAIDSSLSSPDSDNDEETENGMPERIADITARMQEIESKHEIEPRGRSLDLLDYLHECLDEADRWLATRAPVDVLEVIRRHVQEVVARLNDAPGKFLANLDDAPPGGKEDVIVDVYFNQVRPVVTGEKAATAAGGSGGVGAGPMMLTPTAPKPGVGFGGGRGGRGEERGRDGQPAFGRPRGRTPVRRTTSGRVLEEPDPRMLDLLWCVLMFRMVCWLMLHNFHKKDIQKPRSELLGSRFPVYFS